MWTARCIRTGFHHEDACKRFQRGRALDAYVTIRGNIAHRTAHDDTVSKNWGVDYLNAHSDRQRHSDRPTSPNRGWLVGAVDWAWLSNLNLNVRVLETNKLRDDNGLGC